MRREARLLEARASRRREILDAALELFITHGYGQVSIRSIASRADYSPAAIYGYFTSKDDIFFALAEEGFRHLGAGEQADEPSDDPLEDVHAIAWRLYEFSKEQPQYFTLVFLDRHVPRVSREYERFAFISEMRRRAMARVERCVAAGLFPHSTAADLALRLLWAPIVGIVALKLSNRLPGEVDADALVRDAIATTIAGIRAGAPRHSGALVS
jgi:AcrR family transcriptional regulator